MPKHRPNRDSQRSKVYAWELEHVDSPMMGERIYELSNVRDFVDRVLAEHGITWASSDARLDGATFHATKAHLVYWKHGSRSGHFNAGGWCGRRAVGSDGIPTFQSLRVSGGLEIILHEIAHLILDQTRGAKVGAGHDGTFVRALIELLARYSDTWKGKEGQLILNARACGLIVSSRPILADLWRPAGAPPKVAAPKTTRARSTCTESPGAIVRRIARANLALAFAEIVRLAVAEGVNQNTARGALVRFKQQQKLRNER